MTSLAPQLDAHILGLVQAEAREHLDVMNTELLAREQDDKASLAKALRAAHSLKGTAAAAGLEAVEHAMHNWESCTQAVERGHVELTPEGFDLLYRLLDLVECEVQAACTGVRAKLDVAPPTHADLERVFGAELALLHMNPPELRPLEQEPTPKVGAEDPATLRVATAKVDRLMANVEELVQVKAGSPARTKELMKLSDVVEALSRGLGDLSHKLGGSGAHNDSSTREMVKALRGRADEAARMVSAAYANSRRHSHSLDTLAGRLQDDIRSVRMVPIQNAFGVMPRVVRDLGRKLGKRVAIQIEGGENEMDRDLLESIKDPLLHLLRNAVSHGVESPQEREALGKPEISNIVVSAQGTAGGLQLTVRDDGAGIDVKKVRDHAVRQHLMTTEDIAKLSDREAMDLVFLPGLSTAESVDEVSGRGVGLDAVREVVESSGGRVTVESERGVGTTFSLRLPVNLATLRMLLVRVGKHEFALPINSVVRILRVNSDGIRQVDSGFALELEGRAVPVYRLDRLLELDDAAGSECRHGLVLASGADRVALLVDSIVGEQELIAKSLGDHLRRVDKIAGATVLASGRIVPLLNVGDLVRHSSSTRAGQLFPSDSDNARVQRRVLVVDDSITTRTLEKSILEAVGYFVEVATDGEDALSRLNGGKFDLVLSDVQMPRMDGITLVGRIKQNERWRNLPVVLVSSLDDEQDKRRGLDAGADAYLGKKDFRQELLLDTLERLI